MKKFLLVFVGVLTLTFSSNVKAQVTVDGFEAILLAAGDAEKLTEAYINPHHMY